MTNDNAALLLGNLFGYDVAHDEAIKMAQEVLRNAAPAKWIVKKDAMGHTYTYCSRCETSLAVPRGTSLQKLDMRGTGFCPVCGVRMVL